LITGDNFATIALSFQGVETTPHFNRTGFKVTGKRMFATYLADNNTANVFLTPAEQRIFCEIDPAAIYPVPNKWGEKGATTFELNAVAKDILQEALYTAYKLVMAPPPPKKKG
jgi:YjbR